MGEIVSNMGLIAGCLCIYCGALVATVSVINCFRDWNEERKWDRCARYMAGELSSMARWCSYDFPIIEDITEELLSNLNNGGLVCDNSSFRNKLRAKYKKASDEQK